MHPRFDQYGSNSTRRGDRAHRLFAGDAPAILISSLPKMDSRSAGWFCRRTGAACLYSDLRKDLIIGESWLLRRAALAGDPQAATLMGDLCIRSGPLPPNYTETSWYSRA